MQIEQQYIDLFREQKSVIDKYAAEILNVPRNAAFEAFCEEGLPTKKKEYYRHTDIVSIFAPNYGMNFTDLNFSINPYESFRCGVPGFNSQPVFVLNDIFCKPATPMDLPNGVLAGSLRDFSKSHPQLIEKYYNKLAGTSKDATVSMNTMFAQDGFFLYVPQNIKIEKPIQLVNILCANVDLLANSRNLIVLEEGASASLLICDHTKNKNKYACNRLTEVFVGENAYYEHYKFEDSTPNTQAISTVLVKQEKTSKVYINEYTLHNGVSRNNVQVDLDGEGAELSLCGMAIGNDEQHIDTFTKINHNVPSCKSNELYKYLLNGNAVGSFFGDIYVAKDAQKTEAFQSNKNICNSDTAQMFTQPELIIFADDVRCNHGATVGQLDETALFYLRSRGIPEEEARLLITSGFLSDIIEKITIPAVKDNMRRMVERRLRGDLESRCEGCSTKCNH